jgi:hypothetical protein
MGASRFGIVAVFLSLASFVGDGGLSLGAWVGRALAAWALMLPLRLRDDLASLPSDRQDHPDRVLVRTTDLSIFWGAVLVVPLVAGLGFWLLRGAEHLWMWAGLVLVFELAYRLGGASLDERNWSHLWVLAKYPVLVLLLQSRPIVMVSSDFLAAGALVYVTFGVFELLDAGILGRSRLGPLALWSECTLAGALCVFLLVRQVSFQSTWVPWVMMLPWWGLAWMSSRLVHPGGQALKWAPASFGLAFVGLAWIVVNS